jgi:cell shape-determining protein MreC
MSKDQENVEKIRVSWGDDNDFSPGDGVLDAETLQGSNPQELPVSDATQVEIDRIDNELANRTIGSWTFDPATATLTITSVPEA